MKVKCFKCQYVRELRIGRKKALSLPPLSLSNGMNAEIHLFFPMTSLHHFDKQTKIGIA